MQPLAELLKVCVSTKCVMAKAENFFLADLIIATEISVFHYRQLKKKRRKNICPIYISRPRYFSRINPFFTELYLFCLVLTFH